MTQRARFCAPKVNMWHFVSTYKDQIKWQKSFWPQYQFVLSKRRIPSVFFLKFVFSKLFIAIFTLKMYNFLYANSNGVQTEIFWLFTFVKILIHSPAQDLSNKKNRSFLRLLWAQIFLPQFIKFWHKRAILCAPTVRCYI